MFITVVLDDFGGISSSGFILEESVFIIILTFLAFLSNHLLPTVSKERVETNFPPLSLKGSGIVPTESPFPLLIQVGKADDPTLAPRLIHSSVGPLPTIFTQIKSTVGQMLCLKDKNVLSVYQTLICLLPLLHFLSKNYKKHINEPHCCTR